MRSTMQIKVNEQDHSFEENASLGSVRDRIKSDADLLIVNGFPASAESVLNNGDQVVLIKRGEAPGAEEFDALMTARHTPGVHATVKGATIGIAGVGGLGSAIAIALARTGIGSRQNSARGLGPNHDNCWVLHCQPATDVAIDPFHMAALFNASSLGDQVEHIVRPVLDGGVGHTGMGLDHDLNNR